MTLIDVEFTPADNPVDTVEALASLNQWSFERSGEDEITINVEGHWCAYHLSLSWMEELESLHLACAFEIKVPAARRQQVMHLLALVNEQMWMGHFDIWSQEGLIMYRHGMPVPEGMSASEAQIAMLIEAAVESCERYFQAFQFVVWAGKSPDEALAEALFETVGEA